MEDQPPRIRRDGGRRILGNLQDLGLLLRFLFFSFHGAQNHGERADENNVLKLTCLGSPRKIVGKPEEFVIFCILRSVGSA